MPFVEWQHFSSCPHERLPTWTESLIHARGTVPSAVADQGFGKAPAAWALEVPERAHAATLIAEVATVIMPIAVVEVWQAVPGGAAELA